MSQSLSTAVVIADVLTALLVALLVVEFRFGRAVSVAVKAAAVLTSSSLLHHAAWQALTLQRGGPTSSLPWEVFLVLAHVFVWCIAAKAFHFSRSRSDAAYS